MGILHACFDLSENPLVQKIASWEDSMIAQRPLKAARNQNSRSDFDIAPTIFYHTFLHNNMIMAGEQK